MQSGTEAGTEKYFIIVSIILFLFCDIPSNRLNNV